MGKMKDGDCRVTVCRRPLIPRQLFITACRSRLSHRHSRRTNNVERQYTRCRLKSLYWSLSFNPGRNEIAWTRLICEQRKAAADRCCTAFLKVFDFILVVTSRDIVHHMYIVYLFFRSPVL